MTRRIKPFTFGKYAENSPFVMNILDEDNDPKVIGATEQPAPEAPSRTLDRTAGTPSLKVPDQNEQKLNSSASGAQSGGNAETIEKKKESSRESGEAKTKKTDESEGPMSDETIQMPPPKKTPTPPSTPSSPGKTQKNE